MVTINCSTKEDILKNVSNQTVDVSNWIQSMESILFTNILQNILFCV